MTNELGFGIAGSGMVAKVHAEAIAAIPGARLVAIWGRDPERARALASTYSAQPFTDYNEFLNHPGLNVVNICTPNGAHAEFGIAAAERSRHVLVEKPIEVSLNAADELINACERNGVKLGVIFQSRFLPAAVRIKNAVDEGSLGQLFLGDAYVKWYRSPEYYADSWHGTRALDGGGALINQAIHTADLLRWIMGPAETVFAFRSSLRYPQLEGEDTLVANIRFANGALGVIEATTSVSPGFKRRLEISGQKGTVILDGDSIGCWALSGSSDSVSGEGETITDGSADPAAIASEGHRRQIADMIEAIRENRDPVVTGPEGRKSLELVLAIYRSAEQGQPVKLDYSSR